MAINGAETPHLNGRTFRPIPRQEGMDRTETTPETAIALALRQAQDKKAAERKAERDATRKRRLDRLEMLRARNTEPKPKPAPQRPDFEADQVEVSAEEVAAMAEKLGAPGTPERRDHMRRIGQIARDKQSGNLTAEQLSERMRRIAKGESPKAPPPPPERYVEPRAVPPAPNDPRLLNGTLAPSERVAEHIAKAAETAAPSAPPVTERPLQDSRYPAAYAELLENGTPEAILGGRKLAKLNDHERECYQRAKMRHMRARTEGTGFRHKPRRPRMSLDHMSPLGRTITTFRMERAWTIAELAKESSVPPYIITQMLNKRADSVSESYLEKLASAFGIEVQDLTHPPKAKAPKQGDMSPGERLGFLMQRANLGVAALCRLSGLSRTTIDNALKGSRPLSTWSAKKLAPILKTYPAKLMTIPTATAAAIPEPQLEDEVAEAAAPPPAEEAQPEPQGDGDILVANIRRLARAKGWSDRDVGRKAGTYVNFMANLSMRGGVPKAATLKQIADALGTTVEALLAPAGEQPAPAAPPPPPATVETYGAVVVADEHPAAELVEADQVTFVGRVEIEDGIPLPASFRLSAEMYRLDEMKPGQSIKAVVPWGLPFDVFRNRFAVMVHHAQTKSGFWFHSEASADRTFIRLWRVI